MSHQVLGAIRVTGQSTLRLCKEDEVQEDVLDEDMHEDEDALG